MRENIVLSESVNGDRRLGNDITNLPAKRNRTRTYKFFDGTTHNNIHFDEKATRTKTTPIQHTRTEKPIKKRADAIPKQPERTPKGTRIVCDRKIEGQCRIFNVNATMLSQRSAAFKHLFEVNTNESILIEAVPDRTLEMVINFCHGKSFTECSNSDMASLLLFADIWEIFDLKKFIEEHMVQKITPENVVVYANSAISSHSEIVGNACKGLILEKLKNHEFIQNISKLDDRLRVEIIHLQYNQAC